MICFLIFILLAATSAVPYFGERPSTDGAAFVGFIGSLVTIVWAAILLWMAVK